MRKPPPSTSKRHRRTRYRVAEVFDRCFAGSPTGRIMRKVTCGRCGVQVQSSHAV
jgi:hypothetical protein